MGTLTSAGGKLALVLFLALVLALAGCGSPADARAITALVDAFVDILTATDGSTRAVNLEAIFSGLDPSGTASLLEGLAPMSPDLRCTIKKIKFLPFDGASLTVDLGSEGTTSTLELKAVKVGGAWKLDPSFHVTQRLNEVKAPGS
jgi:hypothetical protein